jgi:hypothetical protein
LEQYSTARHQIGFYLNVIVAATYELPDIFTLPVKDYIYRACAALIAEHPVLSAIPAADDTQQPYFVRLPQIDLDQVVTFHQRQTTSGTEDGEPVPDHDLQVLIENSITRVSLHRTPIGGCAFYQTAIVKGSSLPSMCSIMP